MKVLPTARTGSALTLKPASVAVCDGMSQSLFPQYWAQLLAQRYTSERSWYPSKENIQALCPFWYNMVCKRLNEMRENGISTWRAENMLTDRCSAGATLAGVRFDGNNWICNVLGDSCLIMIDESKVSGIYSSMQGFGNYPDYYDSNPDKPGKGDVKTFTGILKGTMLLVTDALGEFLSKIRGTTNERQYVQDLLSVESADEFEILVEWWRKNGMHNDDTTLVVISNSETSKPFLRQEEWVW